MIRKLTVRVKGLHLNTKIKEVKTFFAPLRVVNVQFFKNGVCLVSFQREEDYKKALLKQGQVHGRPVRVCVWSEKSINPTSREINDGQSKPVWPVKSAKQLKSSIRENGRLFVRNLSFDCTEEDLERLFSTYGSLSDIHISYDVGLQKSKGIAFVTFLFPADAVSAFEKLDKTKFMGRLLHILPAEDPPERNSTRYPQHNHFSSSADRLTKSEYQEAKHTQLKASATVAHNWNTLFVQPDAVATYLAAKFGLTKEQVLDPSGHDSVAVRLALAETQLVTEMREFLQKHNVELEAFTNNDNDQDKLQAGHHDRLDVKSGSTHRQVSGTAFLIKNLPVGTTEVEVRELLQRYTKQVRHENSTELTLKRFRPKRVIVPPLGITAIVEYGVAQQARLIYRSLAYEPFGDNILYVQWLPHGALKTETDFTEDTGVGDICIKDSKNALMEEGKYESEFELLTSPPDSADQPAITYNPASKKSKKRKHLNAEESLILSDLDESGSRPSVKQRKYKNKKERISQQENVQHTKDEPVSAAETKETNRTVPSAHAAPKICKPVLLVRNVPFQATQKELSALFQPIGGLVRVRLPKKAAGGHRGFAFLEFTTVDQAKAAMESFGMDTHFLGRRLRIEFAQA